MHYTPKRTIIHDFLQRQLMVSSGCYRWNQLEAGRRPLLTLDEIYEIDRKVSVLMVWDTYR